MKQLSELSLSVTETHFDILHCAKWLMWPAKRTITDTFPTSPTSTSLSEYQSCATESSIPNYVRHSSLWHVFNWPEKELQLNGKHMNLLWADELHKTDCYCQLSNIRILWLGVCEESQCGRISTQLCETNPAEWCLHARGVSLTTAKSLLLYTIVKLSVCGWLSHSAHSSSVLHNVAPCPKISKLRL